MRRFAAILASLALFGSSLQGKEANPMAPSQAISRADVQAAAPALDHYTQHRLFGEVWKRPGLSARDRGLMTAAALIARNQAIEMPFYFNIALYNELGPSESS